ncbi:epoxyqueuosine reductase QueH [Candidatus Gracilibacteria bacterium]|nr:epoxyqueuosine reductase QueH [Candidatus Gracilibacteria bacterium]
MQKYKIGIDEAGRGPWLGAVVAAAFSINPENPPEDNFLEKLNDSKKLSEKNREKIFSEIIELSRGDEPKIFFGVGVVDNFFIDEKNIKQANKEAMRRAIIEIKRKIEFFNYGKELKIDVFIDGNDNYAFEELDRKPIFIIGGDAKVPEISAASIIAKVFRDDLMKSYALLYPDLGLEKHKGYGTKFHKDYLKNPTKITGIHRLSYKPVKETLEQKPKLLLHICCGPDACIPIGDLKKDYEVICFWYDPNIQPRSEYDKRLKAFQKVCELEKVDYIVGEYDIGKFFEKIKGLEHTPERGEKCTKCYDMRLERTALEARRLGIKYWTSTLNNSPHKDLEKMFALGEKWSEEQTFDSEKKENLKEKLDFLKIAFRKNGGFERSVEYTKKHKIYRQNYCGCIYSDTFPGGKEKFLNKSDKN